MPSSNRTTWGGSLHSTFRILPEPLKHLTVFLSSDGLTPDQVLALLPYEPSRARGATTGVPDPKRYRDSKQVYQTAGLLTETDGVVRLTSLGHASRRWLDIITEKNAVILGRHAAYGLSACQLRNPTGAGQRYAADMEVFPFAFIWRAMLALENKISSDELNRAIFKVKNESELDSAIASIDRFRATGDVAELGDETETGKSKNDRIIPWISIASFGWILIADKRSGADAAYYEIPTSMIVVVAEAARVRHRHRDFVSVDSYVHHIARSAALPPDLR